MNPPSFSWPACQRPIIQALLLILLGTGCLDEIGLGTGPAPEGILVVQGRLTYGTPATISVSLTNLFRLDGINTPPEVIDAIVVLRAGDGRTLQVPHTGKGRYERLIAPDDPGFPVQPGERYQLLITSAEGRQYESSPELLLPVPKVGKLAVALETRNELSASGEVIPTNYLQYFIDTPLQSEPGTPGARLQWEFNGAYRLSDYNPQTCYISRRENFDEVFLFDGAAANTDNLTAYPFYEDSPDYRYAEGYYLIVVQRSLSEGAFRYWEQVRSAIERSGTIFEEPAGKIRGNLHSITDPNEEVFGYFYATRQDTAYLFVRPGLADSPSILCVTPPPNPNISITCRDCLSVPNSTLTRPSFWIE